MPRDTKRKKALKKKEIKKPGATKNIGGKTYKLNKNFRWERVQTQLAVGAREQIEGRKQAKKGKLLSLAGFASSVTGLAMGALSKGGKLRKLAPKLGIGGLVVGTVGFIARGLGERKMSRSRYRFKSSVNIVNKNLKGPKGSAEKKGVAYAMVANEQHRQITIEAMAKRMKKKGHKVKTKADVYKESKKRRKKARRKSWRKATKAQKRGAIKRTIAEVKRTMREKKRDQQRVKSMSRI